MEDCKVTQVFRGPNNGNSCDAVFVVLETPSGPRQDVAPVLEGDFMKALLVALMRACDHSVRADPKWKVEAYGVDFDHRPGAYDLFAPDNSPKKPALMQASVQVRTPAGRLYTSSWKGETLDPLLAWGNALCKVIGQHEATKNVLMTA